MKKYAIGVDYGTSSCRALVVDVTSGEEIASAVYAYAHGEDGVIVDKKDHFVARQHPADYLEGMETAVTKALKAAKKTKGFAVENVIGIGVDTTGSTPIPVDKQGTPLCFSKEFRKNPNALAWLWKDHTAHAEAAEITEKAHQNDIDYTKKTGGVYSSEWFFSKILHCLRVDPKVFDAAFSWVELCDYLPAVLTGVTDPLKLKRSVCAAGHKAFFSKEWGGLPSKEFLSKLDPKLADLRDRLFNEAYPAGFKAGTLCKEWSRKLGLPETVAVSVGAFDAHMGAVGAGASEGHLVKIIGTSTCDITVAPLSRKLADIPGVCGIVEGSVMEGYYGLEAGQSAVGDIFNWFVKNLVPMAYAKEAKDANISIHQLLTKKALRMKVGETGLMALDWNNGNRTIIVDQLLTGLLVGQTLHTKPEEIYRALIESTGFGARMIVERFEEFGVKVEDVIFTGGIADKNDFLNQTYADILGRPVKISRSSQTCALGAALFGAVAAGKAAGGFSKAEEGQEIFCRFKSKVFTPIRKNADAYNALFGIYRKLHDSFGLKDGALSSVMKDLIKYKQA
jgi:L-ribulokinase